MLEKWPLQIASMTGFTVIFKFIKIIHTFSDRFEFIETCWERDPSQRPTMTEVCKELDKYLAVTEGRRAAQKPPHV